VAKSAERHVATGSNMVTLDGNEAAAYVAHLTNEVIAIYPITRPRHGRVVGRVVVAGRQEPLGHGPGRGRDAERGRRRRRHPRRAAGGLAVDHLHGLAGPAADDPEHVQDRRRADADGAARLGALAGGPGLSIFGDHSDVMACRATGYAMLCSASVQEVMDFALIAQAATLESRVPFLHFFDGFRTSHEVTKIDKLPPRPSAR
jgi:pyruvate-ferredoxin/flavodoxin oxidoreductase